MYTYVSYLGRTHEDIVSEDEPLIITAAGHYKVTDDYRISTNRRLGRKDYQLLYIADGQVEFYFGDKIRWVGKGNMIIFTPDTPQRYYLYAKHRPQTYWVHFTGNEAQALIDRYNMPQNIISYIGAERGYEKLFKNMTDELNGKKYGCSRCLELFFEQLLIEISRNLFSPREPAKTDIERAVRFFEQHFAEDISIESYAKSLFIKPCWFIRKFKATTGVTPMQYIIDLRIARAKELLENGTYNVSQVASSVGYGNPLYFSRLFKKYTGLSPKEYKRSCKKT